MSGWATRCLIADRRTADIASATVEPYATEGNGEYLGCNRVTRSSRL
jgi:hypothetical protein